MDRKYELLTNDTITFYGSTLYRIRALRDFGDVKKGDLGGYIASESNLSQEDNSWVYDKSRVHKAQILGNAKIYDNSVIINGTIIKGNVSICNSTIDRFCMIQDNVEIMHSIIAPRACIRGNTLIKDSKICCSNFHATDKAKVINSVMKGGYTSLFGDAYISNTTIPSSVSFGRAARIKSPDDYIVVQPIGSRDDECVFYNTDHGIFVTTGCFNHNISRFIEAVNKTHENDEFYRETYLLTAEYAKKYFRMLKIRNKNREVEMLKSQI